MELLSIIPFYVSLFGSMALVPAAAVLALRKRYRSGALLGVTSVVFLVAFEWLWHSAFVRPGEGRSWIELAFAKAGAAEIAILTGGLLATLVNVLFLARQKALS